MIAETIRERLAQKIQYVTPVPYASATGLAADVYQQMQAGFLPVPPLTLHSPVRHLMAGVWSILRETLHTGQVDRGIKEAVAAALKGLTGRLFGATAGKRLVSRALQQGDSLKFVPQAQLPDDLSWAAANPAVAGAFAGFAAVVEEAGNAALPEPVRVLVRDSVQAWHGEAMSMRRDWIEDALVDVKDEHRAVARLALLTALASYQVDAGVVEGFQAHEPDDAQLIAATAWASFTAARRVGTWLHGPTPEVRPVQGRAVHTQPEYGIR